VETAAYLVVAHQRLVQTDYKQIYFAVNYQVGYCQVAVECAKDFEKEGDKNFHTRCPRMLRVSGINPNAKEKMN
jgi:hypothetical protein